MNWLRVALLRLRGVFAGPRRDAELDEELRAHLEMLVEENVERGMSPDNALRAARLSLGGSEQIKEAVRQQRGLPLVESYGQDVRFGLRMLRKNPGFTAVAVLILALGIGANTAIYSLLDSLIVRSLPVRGPQQLLMLKWMANKTPSVGYSSFVGTCLAQGESGDKTGCSFSEPFYRSLRAQNAVFSSLAAFAPTLRLKVTAGDQTVFAFGNAVSGNYFQTLGIQPFRGRLLDDADDRPSAAPAIVLNYGFWQKTLGGDPSIVGQTIKFGGATFAVVGIAQPDFNGLAQSVRESFWISLSSDALVRTALTSRTNAPQNWWVTLVARLKQDTSAKTAQTAASSIFVNEMKAQPSFFGAQAEPKISLVPVEQEFTTMRQESSKALFTLMGVVGIVLLIACANIGGLCLARGATRSREMAVRHALGAPRGRLVRQMFAESAILAAAGGAAGIQLAFWATDALHPWLVRIAKGLPQAVPGPNLRVLLFTAVVSMLTAVLFGFLPSLYSTRVDVSRALKIVDAQALNKSGAWGGFGLGSVLVVAQVALTVALLAGAGLLLRTFRNLETVDVGFDSTNLLLFTANWGTEDFTPSQVSEFNQRFIDQLRTLPGVVSASYSSDTPLGGSLMSRTICCSGTADPGSMRVDELPVSPEFFSTMRVPILAGRAIEPGDLISSSGSKAPQTSDQKSLVPIVVNQEFVRRYFAGQYIVGKILQNYRIIGVVGNLKYGNLRREIQPAIYSPANDAFSFEVRAPGNPEALISEARDAAAKIDRQLKLSDVTTQTDQIEKSISGDRFITNLLTCFAGLALALACIGVFGLLSYDVTSQTREIGIRVALGAQRREVLQLVIAKGMAAAVAGVTLGLVLTCGVTRYIETLLFGVRAIDGATFAVAALVLLVAALAACWIPARRATKVDPMVALRYG